MRKLIAFEFLSLDGYMAGIKGQEMEFVTSNFLNEMEIDIAKEYENTDTFLFGRITYESLSQYWPNVTTKEEPLADVMNNMQKIVFSSKLKKVNWNNTKLINSNMLKYVEELKKANGKNLMLIGSASIFQTLTIHHMIDEYKFLIFPIILGNGKPLFSNLSEKINLSLTKTKVYENDAILLTYKKN